MALGIFTVGTVLRFTLVSMLEVINNDYVRAARAKGLSEWTVIRRHVMRPALLPIATVTSLAFGSLLSGTVLVENIFSWPGIGEYAYLSAINLDLPAIMGVSIVVAVIYIVINLLVDLLYSVLDPRIERPMSTRDALPLEAGTAAGFAAPRRGPPDPQGPGRVRPPWRQPLAVIGATIILTWVVVAIFAPELAPYSPNLQFAPLTAAPSHVYLSVPTSWAGTSSAGCCTVPVSRSRWPPCWWPWP